MSVSLPYGKGQINFKTPDRFNLTFLTPKQKSPVKDVESKIKQVLSVPTNSKPLSELAKGKNSACVIVTDITRECPDALLLPSILKNLELEIPRKNIILLIASGMHRIMTPQEKETKYGKNLVDCYRIIDHKGDDEKNLINLGNTKNGTPIIISKIAYESELLVALGVVEPHQFAGYSGGYKTLAIGAAGDQTISQTHSSKMLGNPRTAVGRVDGNPIYEDIVEIGKKTGLDFIVNVVLGNENEILEIGAGSPLETQRSLIKKAQSIYEVQINKVFDVAICGVGFPRDSNLYQVSRAASYLFFANQNVLRKGGYIVIPARCEEGEGTGVGEKRFLSLLKNKSLQEIINSKKQFKAGEQRAFLVANVLTHCKVIIVGSLNPSIVQDAKMIPAKDMQEAFNIITENLQPKLDVVVIPHSLITVPING